MLKKLFGVLAVAIMVITVYPFALAASGHGVDWYWWMSSPPGTRMSAETQHNAMAVQHLMELHPADWGGIWVEGEGLGPVYSRNAVVVQMQWPDPRILGMLRDISPRAVLARWVPGPKPQLVTVPASITS